MTTLDPDSIRKIPMRRDLPYNGLTREQCEAIGIDPDSYEAARVEANADHAARTQREATEIVAAAREAISNGELTPARAASIILSAGTESATLAHDTLIAIERESEQARYRTDDILNALDSDSIEEYANVYEARRANDREKAEQKIREAQTDLARKQLENLTSTFQSHVAATPDVDPVRAGNLLRQHVIEQGVPETEQERDNLVRTVSHLVTVSDEVVGSLREQARVSAKIAAKERARTGTATTTSQWNKDLADDEEARFQALLASTPVAPEALKPPATPAELEAREVEKVRAKNDREQGFANHIGKISAHGARPGERDMDMGKEHTERSNAFRDAMARAEQNVMTYTPPSPEPKRDANAWVDEFGPGLL